MAEVVNLDSYKAKGFLRDGFAIWHQKFDGRFDELTCLHHLSANTLCRLAEPGDESTDALYGMIIGFLGYGRTLFHDLDASVQSLIIDIQLFMADRICFETMVRIGWLIQFRGNNFSLFDMVRHWEQVKAVFLQHPPLLSSNHPDYLHYRGLIHCDRQVFIRRLVPTAIDAFKKANGL